MRNDEINRHRQNIEWTLRHFAPISSDRERVQFALDRVRISLRESLEALRNLDEALSEAEDDAD